MPTLNLLPDFQKKQLSKKRSFILAETMIGVILFLSIISASVLTITRLILIKEYSKIESMSAFVNAENSNLENKIDVLNDKIQTADKIQQNFGKWSEVISKLTTSLPIGITLNYLQLDNKTKTLRINGKAKDRSALLAAKAALENNPLIKSLDAPLTNLLEKSDFEFRFTGQLQTDAFMIKSKTEQK